MGCSTNKRIVVIKVGGSVLEDTAAYEACAKFLVRRLRSCSEERFVVVVSAQQGITDELERLASDMVVSPSGRALDLLWSTGEIRSVALLTLCLEQLGAEAAGLNIHEAGVRITGNDGFPYNIDFAEERIQQALSAFSIAVVPGFLGTDRNGVIRSLGRGGSDLTAVVLAAALEAVQCELIKDVPGYFTEDPHEHRAARHLPSLTFPQAIALADAGCALVQKEALELAAQSGLRIIVRSLDDDERNTVVGVERDRAESTEGVIQKEQQVAECQDKH